MQRTQSNLIQRKLGSYELIVDDELLDGLMKAATHRLAWFVMP